MNGRLKHLAFGLSCSLGLLGFVFGAWQLRVVMAQNAQRHTSVQTIASPETLDKSTLASGGLLSDIGGALRLENGRVQSLNANLESEVELQLARIRGTLRNCRVALMIVLASMMVTLTGLAKVHRDRKQAFQGLCLAQVNEQRRSDILEMVARHAPLVRVLDHILEVLTKEHSHTGAAIWVGKQSEMQLATIVNLPASFTQVLWKIRQPVLPADGSAWPIHAQEYRSAYLHQLEAIDRVPLYSSGSSVGLLQLYAPVGSQLPTLSGLAEMVQLAAIAIESHFLQERLAFQVHHDTLTELPNRLLFQDRVQQAIALARRHRTKLAVICLDLDRFKQVNDLFGHRAGDAVLCEVAHRLSSCLRESDTVARVGGDEFMVLIGGLASEAGVDVVLQKLTRSFDGPVAVGEQEVTVTASAGVSLFPEHGGDPETLIRNSDLAVHAARNIGRNECKVFVPQLGAAMERRLNIQRELKTALARDEFSIEYQPLVARDGVLVGLEALARWKNDRLGHVAPVEFIPVVEDLGLMPTLGEWVVRRACHDGVKWMSAGYQVPRIAVNVSALQFNNGSFITVVRRALRDSKFSANKLEIEVTETILIDNLEQVVHQIESLRKMGVKFAIDDFGTGYSSLSQLRTLPVDTVKIDGSFTKCLDSSANGSIALVRGIVALAHSLRLRVVAEGVETKEQLAVLNGLGCDVSQGFFLYRPMPFQAVQAMLPRSGTLETSEPASGSTWIQEPSGIPRFRLSRSY